MKAWCELVRCGYASDEFYTTTSAEGFRTNIWSGYAMLANVGVIDQKLVVLGRPSNVSIELDVPAGVMALNFTYSYTSHVVVGTSFLPSFAYSFDPSTGFMFGGGGSQLIGVATARTAYRTKLDSNGGVLKLLLGAMTTTPNAELSADNFIEFDRISVELLCDGSRTSAGGSTTRQPISTTARSSLRTTLQPTQPPAISCRALYANNKLSCDRAPSTNVCGLLSPFCESRLASIDRSNYTNCRAPCSTCRTLLVASACNACSGCRFRKKIILIVNLI